MITAILSHFSLYKECNLSQQCVLPSFFFTGSSLQTYRQPRNYVDHVKFLPDMATFASVRCISRASSGFPSQLSSTGKRFPARLFALSSRASLFYFYIFHFLLCKVGRLSVMAARLSRFLPGIQFLSFFDLKMHCRHQVRCSWTGMQQQCV